MNIVAYKRCTKCGETKDSSHFVKDPQKKDGLYSSCKECYKASYDSAYHAKRAKKYREENHDEYYEHKRAQYWEKHRDGNLERMREYHETHKEEDKEYRVKNRDKISVRGAKWASENKERKAKALREWRAAHPEKVHIQKSNRYSRQKVGKGRITHEEWEAMLEKYGRVCLCCKKSENEIELTLDHVVPLALGGEHSIDNAQPLCRSCNSRKGARETTDYR